jgi:hypothetical protein
MTKPSEFDAFGPAPKLHQPMRIRQLPVRVSAPVEAKLSTALCLMALVVVGCGRTRYPDSQVTHFYPSSTYGSIDVEDPRGVADSRGYLCAGIQLVELDGGAIVVPLTEYMHTLHEGVTHEKRLSRLTSASGGAVAFQIPSDPAITKFCYLLRGITDDTGWRYLELDAGAVREQLLTKNNGIIFTVQDLRDLPTLESRPDADRLWSTYEEAAILCTGIGDNIYGREKRRQD